MWFMLFFGARALRRTGQPLFRARLAQQRCAVFIAGVRESQVMLGRYARIMGERNPPWAMLGKLNSPPHQVEWGVRPKCDGEDLLTTTYFSEQNELLSIDPSILVEVVIIMLWVIKSYLKYIFRESVGPTAKGLREFRQHASAA